MLRELSRKELVRPARQSSMAGEAEYAFWHILARDVAYNQLPRASRASRHVAAAAWIESKAPGRVEDLADVLAYHYATALELARAAGQTEQAPSLEAPALRFLGLAGERALGSGHGCCPGEFRAGARRSPRPGTRNGRRHWPGSARPPSMPDASSRRRRRWRTRSPLSRRQVTWPARRGRWARSARVAPPRGSPRLDAARRGGRRVGAAAARPRAGRSAHRARPCRGPSGQQRGRSPPRRAGARACRAARPAPPGARPRLPRFARGILGDRGGLDDYREAITLATQGGQGREVAVLHNNLAEVLRTVEGPAAALDVLRAGIEFAQARGLTEMVDFMTASTVERLVESGQHEQALTIAAEIATRLEAGGRVLDLASVRSSQTRILHLRGQAGQTADRLDWLETATREGGSVELAVDGLSAAASARAALGQHDQAAALLAEIEAVPGAHEIPYYAAFLPTMVRTALSLGNPELAERLVAGVKPQTPAAEHALATVNAALAEARGELGAAAQGYADAADRWRSFGVVPEQAFALLGQGRCLTLLARDAEATEVLQQAHVIFQTLQAAPALAETDLLLQQADALSA